MAGSKPCGTWRVDVGALLQRARGERECGPRMAVLAQALLGRPYLCDPLGGGPTQTETLTIKLQGFDCVTFVETLLALARSRSTRDFVKELTATRYRQGHISWEDRLHYFSDWMRFNQRRGAIKIRTAGVGSRLQSVTLDLVAALPAKTVKFHVIPKRQIHKAKGRIKDGTVVAFASLRRGLDFFHTGVLFWQTSAASGKCELVLIHAAKSTGQVVAEPLRDFLGRNRMRGMALGTPLTKGDE